MPPIYLDNNATTSLDKEVLHAMLEDLENIPLNPSSTHFFGREAKAKLAFARESVAHFFNVSPSEVIFTSGGTEALNQIIRGIDLKGGHVITSNAEHSAVNKTLQSIKDIEVTQLPVGSWGAVLPEDVQHALQPNTKLIALIGANNETGVKTDIEAIGMIASARNIPFIVDAVSWIGKEPFIMHKGILAIAASGHKFHGPKGSGFLILRKNLKCSPLITGGSQEYGKRGGTENLAGILGIAKALTLLQNQDNITNYTKALRDHLEKGLLNIEGVSINGEGPRISNTTNLAFHGIDAEALLIHLDLSQIAASHGSACNAGALEPSRVLLNMGLSRKVVKSSIRFSLSRNNTKEEIDTAIEIIKNLVSKLRCLS
ncbi:MAG: cysteine desulfurase family protein [Chlamydiales bacterium]|nr:cysteine desulfurase family protein [Chlamydiales bacterium]